MDLNHLGLFEGEGKIISFAGISRTQDPASRDEKKWVGTHGFAKRRFHGRKVFSP